jgi:hypothetical protein
VSPYLTAGRVNSADCHRLIATGNTKAGVSWLQLLKNSFLQMEDWQRRAYLFAIRQLPKDERKFWIANNKKGFSILEDLIAAESKGQP